MKMTHKLMFALLALFMLVPSLIAQVTNVITSTTPLPTTTKDFWKYGIAVAVPIIINLFKKIAPNIPKWLLPTSTPLLGMALGAALKALGQSQMDWIDMAEAGGLAVLVREIWNNTITKATEGGSHPGGTKSIIIGFAAMLAFPAMAAQPSVHGTNKALQAYVDGADKKTAKATAAAIAKEYNDQFQAGEFQIEVAGQARTVDMENFDKSMTFGGNYYLTAGAGLHAAVGLRDLNDRFIDRVEFGLIGRIPVPKLSLALLFGVGTEWQRVRVNQTNNRRDDWSVTAEAGPLVRLSKNLDIFAKVRGVRPIDGAEGEHLALIFGTALTF